MSLQVKLVKQSFQEIQPYADKFVSSFYVNLFTANPEARSLFKKTDMEIQKKKLLGSLVLIVNSLEQPDVLDTVFRALGARNVKYGVLPKHYSLAGNALLATLKQYLGDKWTPQVKQAWVATYKSISKIMLDGADYSQAEIPLPTSPKIAVTETSLQVELIERSFEAIRPNANTFVNSFYKNLFTANPEAKSLFETTDMEAQKEKLLDSLVLVVENLQKPDVLDSTLRGLGARHVKYGALPEHYPLVGNALLTTFQQYLGASWTPEVKQAWVDAYGTISEMMLDGADYSPTDIALKAPSNNVNVEQSVSTASSATATMISTERDQEAESSPIAAALDLNSSMNGEMALQPDTGKIGLYALTGGGIMGIMAGILTLLL